MGSVEANKMLAVAAAACEDKKAEDIRILALDPAESGLSDYFLICTGTNDRQTVAITDEIELRLKHEFGAYPNGVEGRRQGEWILMDYVDFIVHVFLPEKRAFYGLERLRPSATTLSVADLNADIKAAIRAERAPKKAKAAVVDAPSESAIGAEGETETSPKAATRKRTGEGTQTRASSSGKAVRQEAASEAPAPKAVKAPKAAKGSAGAQSAAGKRSAKKAVSAKALDTRGAARASIKGIKGIKATKSVQGTRKTAAKKRAPGGE